MTPDTIKQRTAPFTLADGTAIVVRRMPWKAACAFIMKLGAHLSGIAGDYYATLRAQTAGTLAPDFIGAILPKLPDLIGNSEELAAYLIEHSTGLPRDQVDKLDLGDALAIIDLALGLNTGADLKNSCAGIGAKLAALMPATMTKKPGAAFTPPSSMPATPPATSTAAPSSTSTSSSDKPAS